MRRSVGDGPVDLALMMLSLMLLVVSSPSTTPLLRRWFPTRVCAVASHGGLRLQVDVQNAGAAGNAGMPCIL